MANNYFSFKQFSIRQERAAFRVTTDSVLLGTWAEIKNAQRILDIGTGTGLLALMAAQRSNALITGVEPDHESYLQAVENVAASPWSSRITLVNSAIQDFHPSEPALCDTILTNPPYFLQSLQNPDPRKALTRHALTLSFDELIQAACRFLSPDGTIQLVLPVPESKLFLEEAEKAGFYVCRVLNVKPKPSHPVSRLLFTLCRSKCMVQDETLVIETGKRHEYSEEYLSLTREFYLDK